MADDRADVAATLPLRPTMTMSGAVACVSGRAQGGKVGRFPWSGMPVLGMISPVRHLTEQQATAALRRGASIEELLTTTLGDGTIRWLSIAADDGGFVLRHHAVLDDGDDDFLDVYEFRRVDQDEYRGEGTVLGIFPDASSAFEAATQNGARMNRWVNSGLIQDEYADLRSAG